MFTEKIKILHQGDQNGNGWIVQIQLPSGRNVFGLATENIYGGDWDLGPTWNYVVQTENPFLIDTGRYGMGGRLLEMIGLAGLSVQDLKGITLSHGHEDHDGGLMELAHRTGIPAWVHPIYRCLSRSYPEQAPHPSKENFSASCWHCFMPESFTKEHCVEYHRNRSSLGYNLLEGSLLPFDSDVRVHHLPGHCPDSMAFQIGEEALIVGDNILPDITPHPSQEEFFQRTRDILPPGFDLPEKIYGLSAYLRSLKKLTALGREYPQMIVLQAHRLFYAHSWRMIELEKRSAEIIEHHLQRCASILSFLQSEGPRTVKEIVLSHFEPKLLKGLGTKMAEGEIKSHLELLEHSGDVQWQREENVEAAGTALFEQYIRNI
jgi:glyoxylase-like metal-dependent hydrolase (beta-lactamase superfamily II)